MHEIVALGDPPCFLVVQMFCELALKKPRPLARIAREDLGQGRLTGPPDGPAFSASWFCTRNVLRAFRIRLYIQALLALLALLAVGQNS